MLRTRGSIAYVGVLAAFVMPALACTAETPPSTGAKADRVKQAPKPKAPTAAASSGTTAPATASTAAAAAAAACKALQGDACNGCCEKAHPAGAQAWESLSSACLCDNARCAAACA